MSKLVEGRRREGEKGVRKGKRGGGEGRENKEWDSNKIEDIYNGEKEERRERGNGTKKKPE